MSVPSNLDSFCNGKQVAVQLVSCSVLPPGLVQDRTQHSCVIAMAVQKQDDQLEHTYSSYVRIRDVALKTCQRR